ncbi:MAG TPA: hypothetical protein VKV57_04720 [bacterium]|nr:hypothetical protein [bacterium]
MRRVARSAATVLAIAAAVLVVAVGRTHAAGGMTPGVAAGGVPITANVETVQRIMGQPADELKDPSNTRIYIQRWEDRCLGARYTPQGNLLALDVWFDVGKACPGSGYTVQGRGGEAVGFADGGADVKRVFGYQPDRVLRASRFTIFVYDAQGIAFYIREGGDRDGHVDVMTVFLPTTSRSVWSPAAWGGR